MVHFLLKYLETFRDIGVLLCGGREIKYLETFRDIGAVLCGVGMEPNQYNMLCLRDAA